jgi:hypothetical protein
MEKHKVKRIRTLTLPFIDGRAQASTRNVVLNELYRRDTDHNHSTALNSFSLTDPQIGSIGTSIMSSFGVHTELSRILSIFRMHTEPSGIYFILRNTHSPVGLP